MHFCVFSIRGLEKTQPAVRDRSRQAGKNFDGTNDALPRMIRETYKWMIVPMQEAKPGKRLSEIRWEHFPVNPGAPNLSQEVERAVKENSKVLRFKNAEFENPGE